MTDVARVGTQPPPVVVGEQVLHALGLDPRDPTSHALVLLCNRYALDPLLGHVEIILTKQGPRTYITRDGMLDIAHRSGQLDGIVVDEQRRNSDNNGWTAFVSVYRKDMSHPFRYGAQCKDAEMQAKSGHGPEMALARAERRALKRAFSIPTADGIDESDVDLDTMSVERVQNTAAARAREIVADASAQVEPEPESESAEVTPREQSQAHQVIAALGEDERDAWLAAWGVDMSEVWSSEAVHDALERPF